MRWSKALIPTLKETPADAVAPSHVLLLRAGMIRQLGARGLHLPAAGLPGAQQGRPDHPRGDGRRRRPRAADARAPADRALEGVGPVRDLRRPPDAADDSAATTQMALGPTHEEVITDLVRDLVRSYKQLPITLYQIQTKFRDEPRPRFGILRTREFLMKDAYSFDADVEQLNASYDAMYEAYCRIFDRCGIPYVVVEAESGPIGGDSSHEFMVPSLDRRGHGHPVPELRLRGQPASGPRSAPGPRRRRARRRRPRRSTPVATPEPADDPGGLRLPQGPRVDDRPSSWSSSPTAGPSPP